MKKIKPKWYRKWFDNPQYLSPFRKTEYFMDDEVTLHSKVMARPRFSIETVDTLADTAEKDLIVSHWEVEYGIHSFKIFEHAQNARDNLNLSHEPHGRISWTIVECVIPIGSKVFKGVWWDGNGDDYESYASSSIIMKEDADYEFDWTDILSFGSKD